MRGLPGKMGDRLFNAPEPGSHENRRDGGSYMYTHKVEPYMQELVCLSAQQGQEGGWGCKDLKTMPTSSKEPLSKSYEREIHRNMVQIQHKVTLRKLQKIKLIQWRNMEENICATKQMKFVNINSTTKKTKQLL